MYPKFDKVEMYDEYSNIGNFVGIEPQNRHGMLRDMDDNLAILNQVNYQRRWAGKYTDISFNIVHHTVMESNPFGTWCYYIILREDDVDQDVFDNQLWLPTREYDNGYRQVYVTDDYNSILHRARWHGGITHYGKHKSYDTYTHKELRYVEVGCDYAHGFDQNQRFSLKEVLYDAQQTCTDISELLNIKGWCKWSGVRMDKREMVEWNGDYYTPAGLGMKSRRIRQQRELKESGDV